MRSGTPRSLLLFALLGGVVAFAVAALGSTELAIVAGLICWAIGLAMLVQFAWAAVTGRRVSHRGAART